MQFVVGYWQGETQAYYAIVVFYVPVLVLVTSLLVFVLVLAAVVYSYLY